MSVDYTAIAQDLHRLDDDAHAHFDLLAAETQSSRLARNSLLSVWAWKTPQNTDLFAIRGHRIGTIMRDDLPPAEADAAQSLESAILSRMGLIADRLRHIPLLNHDALTLAIQLYVANGSPYPRLEMLIDGHPLHHRPLALPSLMERMKVKLDTLRDISAPGTFHRFEVADALVFAPDHKSALIKHGAFCGSKARSRTRT